MPTNQLAVTYEGSGATLYVILRRLDDPSLVWNGTASITWVDGNIAVYDVPLAYQGGDVYSAAVPSGLPRGYTYKAIFYKQLGGTPAITDDILTSRNFTWNGEIAVPSSGGGTVLIDLDKFTRKWGTKALIEVTDKNHTNLTVPDPDLLNDAFLWATGYLNMLMAGGPFATPLEFLGALDPVVEEWAMVLAFARLYYDRFDDSAAVEDVDGSTAGSQTGKKLSNRVDEVFNDIALIMSGGGPTITGATASTTWDITPSLLSPQDVEDAKWALFSAAGRANIW